MKKDILRILDTGFNNGPMNMAIDEAIAIEVSKGDSPPTLRFYRWDPPTLSLGYFQKANKEVDFDGLKKRGVGLVRRPTGGRAVLHDEEITYSIILKEDYKNIPYSITESYRVLSEPLLNGLKRMGLEPYMMKPLNTGRNHTTSACFDAPSSYEIIVNNKKIIGSAQKRFYGVILQHGSIPYRMDIDKLFDCLRFDDPGRKEILKRYFKMKATSIFDELGKELTWEEMTSIFIEEYRKHFNVDIVYTGLTDQELELSKELYKQKYNTDQWNYKF